MQLVNIYCGLDTNGRDVDAHKLVHDLAAKYFPQGHTVIDANGRWFGEVGVIDEPTLIIQVLAPATTTPADQYDHKINRFCQDYKQLANQESVLVTWSQIQVAFV